MRFNNSFSNRPLSEEGSLSSSQVQMDAAFNGMSEQAADPSALAAMVLGSFAFRFTKLLAMEGAAATGLARITPRFLLNTATSIIGLGGEVAAFRASHNIFAMLAGHTPEQGIFNRKGFLGTAVDFAALKLLAPLGSHNSILANFAQSNAMVWGHELSAEFGFTEHEKGSYMERLAQAQVTNFAMGAGMRLTGALTGGRIHAYERTLDRRIEVLAPQASSTSTFFRNLGAKNTLDLTMQTGEATSHSTVFSEAERAQIQGQVQQALQRKSRRDIASSLVHLRVKLTRYESSHFLSSEELEAYRYECQLYEEALKRLPFSEPEQILSLSEMRGMAEGLESKQANLALDNLEYHLSRILEAGTFDEIPAYLKILLKLDPKIKLSKMKREHECFTDAVFRDPVELRKAETWYQDWQEVKPEELNLLITARALSIMHEAPTNIVDRLLQATLRSKSSERVKDQIFFLIFHEGNPTAASTHYLANNSRYQKPNQRVLVLGKQGRQAETYESWLAIQEKILALQASPRLEYKALEMLEENYHHRFEREKEARKLAHALDPPDELSEEELRNAYVQLDKSFARKVASILDTRSIHLDPASPFYDNLQGLNHICRDIPGPLPSLKTLEQLATLAADLYEATGEILRDRRFLLPLSLDGGHFFIGPVSPVLYCERIILQIRGMMHLLGSGIWHWAESKFQIETSLINREGQPSAYRLLIQQGTHESYHGLRIAIQANDKEGVFDYLAKVDLNIHGNTWVIDSIQAGTNGPQSKDLTELLGNNPFNQLLVMTANLAARLGYEEIALVNETFQFAYQDQTRRRGQAGGGLYSKLQQQFFRGTQRRGGYYAIKLHERPASWGEINIADYLNKAISEVAASFEKMREEIGEKVHSNEYVNISKEYYPSHSTFTYHRVFEGTESHQTEAPVFLFANPEKADQFLREKNGRGKRLHAYCLEINQNELVLEFPDRYVKVPTREHPFFSQLKAEEEVSLVILEN